MAEIADIRLGISFRTRLEHDPAGSVAILQMKDAGESAGLSYSGATRGVLPKENRDLLLREGDLVFRSRGRSNGAAIVGSDVPPAVLAAPLLLIRPTGVLPDFLYWFINSDHAQAWLTSVAAGTSVQMISVESLRALPVPVPSEETQQQIAGIARLIRLEEELMNAITARRKQVASHILTDYAYRGVKGVTR